MTAKEREELQTIATIVAFHALLARGYESESAVTKAAHVGALMAERIADDAYAAEEALAAMKEKSRR